MSVIHELADSVNNIKCQLSVHNSLKFKKFVIFN